MGKGSRISRTLNFLVNDRDHQSIYRSRLELVMDTSENRLGHLERIPSFEAAVNELGIRVQDHF